MKILFNLIQTCYKALPNKIQRSLQNTLKQQEIRPYYKIEFQNGDPFKLTNYTNISNRVSLISSRVLWETICQQLFPLENIFLITLLIILFTYSYQDSYSFFILFYTSSSILLSMIISIVHIVIIASERKKYENKINKKTCYIFSDLAELSSDNSVVQQVKSIQWNQLKIGQVVCLQNGEQCPADLLILDSSFEQVLISYETRYPCSSTYVSSNSLSKSVIIDFKINLSGWVQFTEENNNIKGTFKLKNDPKVTHFTQNNLILRGEVLDSQNWIFGMVIRVGTECGKIQSLNKHNFKNRGTIDVFQTQYLSLITILWTLCLVAKMIYDSLLFDDYFFYNATYLLLLYPQNMLWVSKISILVTILKENKLFQQKKVTQTIELETSVHHRHQSFQDLKILQEDETKILIPIPKHSNLYSNFKSNSKLPVGNKDGVIPLRGSQSMSGKIFSDLINADLLLIENPFKIFKKREKVVSAIIEGNRFQFSSEKLLDIIQKSQQVTKSNFEKLLIDTNRVNTYNEQKNIDFELLMTEKNLLPLRGSRSSQDGAKPFQKPGFFRERSQNLKEKKQTEVKQFNPYASFRKASARNLFGANSSLNYNNNSNSNSPKSVQQPKQFFQQKSTYFNRSNNGLQQFKSMDKLQSSDRLIGDFLGEQDFIDKLYSKDDMVMNEMLIMMLVCNNISSYYNQGSKQLQLEFSNRYDPSIIDFTNLFDYTFLCSTIVDNFKSEYHVAQIVKKVVSIQGSVKVFEVLATSCRGNTLTVLVRDPESFLLDEGALIYTRVERNSLEINEQNKIINATLQEMIWEGEKTFLYFKRHLSQQETEEFLIKYNQIIENYRDRQDELEKQFDEIEKKNQFQFAIGMKKCYNILQMSQGDFYDSLFEEDKLFLSLQNYHLKSGFIFESDYEEVIMFLRTFNVVQSKEQILHLYEKENQLLKHKFRQQLQYMIEEQGVMTHSPQSHIAKFVIVSREAYETILQDDYLKYHFIFIIQNSIGIGGYHFNSEMKGKLGKLLKLSFKCVVTLGNSLNNNYLFNKSDVSFSLKDDNTQMYISNPNFIIPKLKQLLLILLMQIPMEMLKLQRVIEIQIYRCLLLGLTLYQITFIQVDQDVFLLLIFFLIPSNIFTVCCECFIQYQQNFQITYRQFPLLAKGLEMSKNSGILKQILKISIIALFDSVLLHLVMRNIDNFNSDGKQLQEVKTLILYICLEFVEKSKYIITIIDDTLFKLKMKFKFTVLYIFNIAFCIFIVQIILLRPYQYYLIDNVREGFFNSIFVIGSSISLKYALDHSFSIEFTETNIGHQILHSYNKIISFISQIKIQDELMFSSRTILTKLFEMKDVVDEQIVKYVKGETSLAEQMKKDLKFVDNRTEKDYISFIKNESSIKLNQLITFLSYELVIVIAFIPMMINNSGYLTQLIISIVQLILQLFSYVFYTKLISNRRIQQALLTISYILRFIFKLLFNINKDDTDQGYFMTILFILACSCSFMSKVGIKVYVTLILLVLIIDEVFLAIYLNANAPKVIFVIFKTILILIEIIYALFQVVYKTEYLLRYSYILQNRLMVEYKKLNDVLGLLMPKFIKERMTKGQIQISEDQGEVTILFCDICDFDNIIKAEGEKIVEFLDNLYRNFDSFCQSHEIQKIETVGKTYMAAAGLKDYDLGVDQTNSTLRILQAAIKMIEIAKTMKFGQNEELVLKIGIHFGRVIAGVIGAHKPQFSLIGDTVNTTSRVCSTGINGFITLSEQAYFHMQKNPKYEFVQQQVQAKGKGLINTYQLILPQPKENKTVPQILVETKQKDEAIKALEQKKTILKKTSIEDQNKQKLLKKNSSLYYQDKSPKLVIRQRQKDLQIQTPMMVIRRSVDSDQIDYKKQQSQNQIQDMRNRQKSIIQTQNQIKEDIVEEEKQIIQDDSFNKIGNPVSIPSISNGRIRNSQISHQNIIVHPQIKGDLTESQDVGMQQPQVQFQKRRSVFRKTIILDKKQFPIKKQNTKQLIERIPEDQFINQQTNQRLNKQKSLKQIGEGTLSAVFKSPQEQRVENIDEIQIPKVAVIIEQQKELSTAYVKQILKCKVDQYEVLSDETQVYNSTDQFKYISIYDEYKDKEIQQIRSTFMLLTGITIALNMLYLIIIENSETRMTQFVIIVICQSVMSIFLTTVIYKLNESVDQIIIKWLIILYMSIALVLHIVLVHSIDVYDYDIILTCAQISAIYLNIFNLHLYTQEDRKKIALLYLVGSLLMIIYQEYWLHILLFTLSSIIMSYYIQWQEKVILVKNYQCSNQLENQKEKQKSILSYLLPEHVNINIIVQILGRFMEADQNTDNFTDVFENATILFADIAGFTKYSSSVQAEQVVNMLRILFQKFDEICQILNVYKLFTIGDCYVCMGIIDAKNRNYVQEAVNVTLFGLKMIEIINSINKDPQFSHLNMRIGAHAGKIIGGVVGTDVVRYDVYGEDVTIANKMESNGAEGKMMLSETLKDLIESEENDLFEFEFAKDVYIPSKDEMISAYFVQLAQEIIYE